MLLHLARDFLAIDVTPGDNSSKTGIKFSFHRRPDNADFFSSHTTFEDAEKDARFLLKETFDSLSSRVITPKINALFDFCSSTTDLHVSVMKIGRLEVHVSLFNPITTQYQGWVHLPSLCERDTTVMPFTSRNLSTVIFNCRSQCTAVLSRERARLETCMSEIEILVSQARELYNKLGERT